MPQDHQDLEHSQAAKPAVFATSRSQERAPGPPVPSGSLHPGAGTSGKCSPDTNQSSFKSSFSVDQIQLTLKLTQTMSGLQFGDSLSTELLIPKFHKYPDLEWERHLPVINVNISQNIQASNIPCSPQAMLDVAAFLRCCWKGYLERKEMGIPSLSPRERGGAAHASKEKYSCLIPTQEIIKLLKLLHLKPNIKSHNKN